MSTLEILQLLFCFSVGLNRLLVNSSLNSPTNASRGRIRFYLFTSNSAAALSRFLIGPFYIKIKLKGTRVVNIFLLNLSWSVITQKPDLRPEAVANVISIEAVELDETTSKWVSQRENIYFYLTNVWASKRPPDMLKTNNRTLMSSSRVLCKVRLASGE